MTEEARRLAVVAGADGSTLRVADVEETPVSYMAGNTTRLRVKVVGEIAGLIAQNVDGCNSGLSAHKDAGEEAGVTAGKEAPVTAENAAGGAS